MTLLIKVCISGRTTPKKKSPNSQSVMLSSPLPLNEIQPNLVCELLT